MKINETFYSIQGEGVYQGVPMLFIRLQGCNLRPFCQWCDTRYAQDAEDSCQDLSVDQLVALAWASLPSNGWVCITGGEPLRQEAELSTLVQKLSAKGFRAEIETNGSIVPSSWRILVDSWSVDIKCPSSGVAGVSDGAWFNLLGFRDQVKFVVRDKTDLDFAEDVVRRHEPTKATILASPVLDGSNLDLTWARELVEHCKRLNWRFSLQLHKVLWGNLKGV
jgi:7-carboxy-7-deazaguanine synthase